MLRKYGVYIVIVLWFATSLFASLSYYNLYQSNEVLKGQYETEVKKANTEIRKANDIITEKSDLIIEDYYRGVFDSCFATTAFSNMYLGRIVDLCLMWTYSAMELRKHESDSFGWPEQFRLPPRLPKSGPSSFRGGSYTG